MAEPFDRKVYGLPRPIRPNAIIPVKVFRSPVSALAKRRRRAIALQAFAQLAPGWYSTPSSPASLARRSSAVHNGALATSAEAGKCASIQPIPRP